jgi:hypothetical protein
LNGCNAGGAAAHEGVKDGLCVVKEAKAPFHQRQRFLRRVFLAFASKLCAANYLNAGCNGADGV